LRATRVLAVYQPHGYTPTRFLWRDFVEAFGSALRPEDRLWMLEVFYAGGTAQRDFSAADIVRDIAARGVAAEFAPSREWLCARIARRRGGRRRARHGRARSRRSPSLRARSSRRSMPASFASLRRAPGTKAARASALIGGPGAPRWRRASAALLLVVAAKPRRTRRRARRKAAARSPHAPTASSIPTPPQRQFLGVWKLSTDALGVRQDPGRPAHRAHGLDPSRRAAHPPGALPAERQRRDTTTYVYATDGTPTTSVVDGRDIHSVVGWEGRVLHLHSTAKLLMLDMSLDERWQLSADARELTMRRHVKWVLGEGDQTLVFERQ
jgi:hypothetical protein